MSKATLIGVLAAANVQKWFVWTKEKFPQNNFLNITMFVVVWPVMNGAIAVGPKDLFVCEHEWSYNK